MNCYKLNEKVQNKIEKTLENPKPQGRYTDETYFKSIYGPATLMNDWYEKRIGKQNEVKSEPPLSDYMEQYRKPCKSTVPDRREYFNKMFENYGLGQELLTDHLGFAYYDNYTTSYDLVYNHLKKGICGPFPRHYFKGSYNPQVDLTQIFGSLTQWGLKEKIKLIKKASTCTIPPVSETLSEYAKHDLQAVKKLNDFPNFKRIKYISLAHSTIHEMRLMNDKNLASHFRVFNIHNIVRYTKRLLIAQAMYESVFFYFKSKK